MKNINIYLHHIGNKFYFFPGFILFMLVLVSCEDILKEEPKTVSVETFYNTSGEVETAVNSIYSPVRGTIEEQIVILDAHTDWGYGRGSRADYNAMQGFNAANINNAGSRWNTFYLTIRNANLVIYNALMVLQSPKLTLTEI